MAENARGPRGLRGALVEGGCRSPKGKNRSSGPSRAWGRKGGNGDVGAQGAVGPAGPRGGEGRTGSRDHREY